MHLSSILPSVVLFSALNAASTLLPVRINANGSAALTWHVSNFTTGCSPGGCEYHFKITGVETKNTPGFNTTCSGTDEQGDYKPCADNHVLAQMNPGKYPKWNVQVKHLWVDDMGGEFMALGEANVTESRKRFNITVSQVFGVS